MHACMPHVWLGLYPRPRPLFVWGLFFLMRNGVQWSPLAGRQQYYTSVVHLVSLKPHALHDITLL